MMLHVNTESLVLKKIHANTNYDIQESLFFQLM